MTTWKELERFWKCDLCGKQTSTKLGFSRYHKVPENWPPMPTGWLKILNNFYCPDHTISILVDGDAIWDSKKDEPCCEMRMKMTEDLDIRQEGMLNEEKTNEVQS